MTEKYICKELFEYEMALMGVIQSLENNKPLIIKLEDITGDMTQDDEYYKDIESLVCFGNVVMYDIIINFSDKPGEWFILNDSSILAIQTRYNEYIDNHYKYAEITEDGWEIWKRIPDVA
jgi:hypothetical protein